MLLDEYQLLRAAARLDLKSSGLNAGKIFYPLTHVFFFVLFCSALDRCCSIRNMTKFDILNKETVLHSAHGQISNKIWCSVWVKGNKQSHDWYVFCVLVLYTVEFCYIS